MRLSRKPRRQDKNKMVHTGLYCPVQNRTAYHKGAFRLVGPAQVDVLNGDYSNTFRPQIYRTGTASGIRFLRPYTHFCPAPSITVPSVRKQLAISAILAVRDSYGAEFYSYSLSVDHALANSRGLLIYILTFHYPIRLAKTSFRIRNISGDVIDTRAKDHFFHR